MALWALWSWRQPPASGLAISRLPVPFATLADPAIDAAVQRQSWTEYAEYGTVRLGRIARPAHLFSGQRRWVRSLAVPAGGARYEVHVGAIDAPATVRLARAGAPDSTVQVPTGEWTKLTTDLDARFGGRQPVNIAVDVAPGGVIAWGSELVIANEPRERRPDVVLISLDTVRRDQLTSYAPSLPTMPALAAVGREGMVFENAISTSSWTISSHATLFTGRFPPDGLGYHSRVEPGEFTLPEILAASGYRTFGVSGGPYTDPRWGLHQGFDAYVSSAERENSRDAIDRAIGWMSEVGSAPVFLFLNLFDAHEPLVLSEDVKRASGVTEDVPSSLWHELDAAERPMTSAMRERLLAAYRAELTAIDTQLRRLSDHLKASGRWDRTLFIAWSDHGQLLGERGYIGHAYTLDEELLRVPLIIKPPLGSPLGSASYDGLIQGDDLFALVQTLSGLPNADGASIMAALRAGTPIRSLAFAKMHHEPLPALVAHRRWRSATQWAVHDGSTKIVRRLEGDLAAYDVTGVEEQLIAIPSHSATLVKALERFRSWPGHVRSAPTFGPLSPAERERLRSLGYIQ
jgi:arylsulfatase A-like enzyme